MKKYFEFSITTQGPTYPPSEIMDEDGNFIVIGRINKRSGDTVVSKWGNALVDQNSELPKFGDQQPYNIIRELDLSPSSKDLDSVLYTLPLPLPLNNYPIVFAPEQCPQSHEIIKPSMAFHKAVPPDFRVEDGLREMDAVTLGKWINAKGQMCITLKPDQRTTIFECEFENLIPDSLYTIMSLRETDLDPLRGPSRPGPLGIPNVMLTDKHGSGRFWAELKGAFDPMEKPDYNRIVNVILLWMSTRMSNGGAIGLYGLGGDVHAQLKMQKPSFFEITTKA